jgi:ABC-type transport system involved in multi-copper enzyme maturation permease subunit
MEAEPDTIEFHYHLFSAINNANAYSTFGTQGVYPYLLFKGPFIGIAGVWLFLFAVGLGIALGVRQYWVGFFTKTYGFLLHRSAKRGTILLAKLLAAVISFAPLAVIWVIFYFHGHSREYFPVPPSTRTFVEGLVFVGFGFVVYLSTALTALSRNKWYTTKMVGLAFMIWMFITLMFQWQLKWAWITIFVSAVILLIQITDIFLNREFV